MKNMSVRGAAVLAVTAIAIAVAAGPAWAQAPVPPQGIRPEVYEQSFRAVFVLFVLALLLESALALLFNWRPFVENLVPRAVRPIVALFGALVFVEIFNLDVTATLVNATTEGAHWGPTIPGKILTAMVIAGGSAGVNSLLVALGFRSPNTPEKVAPKPPPDKAWLSVRATQGRAQGDLLVFLGPPGPGNLTLMGAIKSRSKRSLWSWFVSDRGRLPLYGGHAVEPERDYVLEVRGVDADGAPLVPTVFGPMKFARGAVVDIDVKI